jgi:hypothetical protein
MLATHRTETVQDLLRYEAITQMEDEMLLEYQRLHRMLNY